MVKQALIRSAREQHNKVKALVEKKESSWKDVLEAQDEMNKNVSENGKFWKEVG